MQDVSRRIMMKAAVAAAGLAAPAMARSSGIQALSSPDGIPTGMPYVAEHDKFTIAVEKENAPNKKGWYHHVAGVIDTEGGLVGVYRLSDSHTSITTDIMICYSRDQGRTWDGHHSIAHGDVWNQGAMWVAPQCSKLPDGRLAIVCDFGERLSNENHPMLSDWQKPNRGMRNYVWWSSDKGRTWDGPHPVDRIGGEPSYVTGLSDGTLVFTRTESASTDGIWDAPLPWGQTYYRDVAVFSDDGGKTWNRTSTLSDDKLQSDCEVGIVELAPKKLLAVARVGFGGGKFGQPSRFVYSSDNGKSWLNHSLSPIYGQRTAVHMLRSGHIFVSYRHVWGTPASYASIFHPEEKLAYEPASYIWDDSRCSTSGGTMILSTEEGKDKGVIFTLYPAQAPDSRVEMEAELRVEQADENGCAISPGCAVRFLAGRICLADRPMEGFNCDATKFHNYKLVREKGEIRIYLDGELKLRSSTAGLESRYVQFGNRFGSGWFARLNLPGQVAYKPLKNRAVTHWKSVSARVTNRSDHSIDWKWSAENGYPDSFRRKRSILLDRTGTFSPGDSGYSNWTQMRDGTVYVANYTVGNPAQPITFIRGYRIREEDLLRLV